MDGGGGPAPFLLKTYEMVDDASTNGVVSWSSTNASFVVWNHTEFAARLLPTYFKNNNFSSFIRQLNTYGFRKIDPERWEFSNDDFDKGLLFHAVLSLTFSSTAMETDGCKCSTTASQLVDQGPDSNDTRIPEADDLTSSTRRDNHLNTPVANMQNKAVDAEAVSCEEV